MARWIYFWLNKIYSKGLPTSLRFQNQFEIITILIPFSFFPILLPLKKLGLISNPTPRNPLQHQVSRKNLIMQTAATYDSSLQILLGASCNPSINIYTRRPHFLSSRKYTGASFSSFPGRKRLVRSANNILLAKLGDESAGTFRPNYFEAADFNEPDDVMAEDFGCCVAVTSSAGLRIFKEVCGVISKRIMVYCEFSSAVWREFQLFSVFPLIDGETNLTLRSTKFERLRMR